MKETSKSFVQGTDTNSKLRKSHLDFMTTVAQKATCG